METSPATPQNMIDTTDALEAVRACQTMKNFMFILIFIGLFLCQIVFWMNHFGLVDTSGCSSCSTNACPACPGSGEKTCSDQEDPQANTFDSGQPAGIIYLAATTEEAEAAPAAETQPASSIEKSVDAIVESADTEKPEDVLLESKADHIPAEIPTEHASPEMLEPQAPAEETEAAIDDVIKDKLALFRISCSFAKILVTICNYVILIAAVLYSLSLLICLKISLTGRLGGINHIARAFFTSLFLLVVLVPWQTILPGVLVGALWQPSAIWGWAKADASMFWKILYFGRFCGTWLAALWLLVSAQARSSKWARATLRRIGVVR